MRTSAIGSSTPWDRLRPSQGARSGAAASPSSEQHDAHGSAASITGPCRATPPAAGLRVARSAAPGPRAAQGLRPRLHADQAGSLATLRKSTPPIRERPGIRRTGREKRHRSSTLGTNKGARRPFNPAGRTRKTVQEEKVSQANNDVNYEVYLRKMADLFGFFVDQNCGFSYSAYVADAAAPPARC